MQMSGDPVFSGVGNSMDTQAALADQSLQQAAHGTIGHEVQEKALEDEMKHRRAIEEQAQAALGQKTTYEQGQLGISQQNADTARARAQAAAAGRGATGQARALAAMEKFGKPGNIPGLIAQLYPIAQLGRDDMVTGKLQGKLGVGEDPSQTWDMISEGLLQEMGNVSHGSASESAVQGFRKSRPNWYDSPVLKQQWLRTVSQWGYHQAGTVNDVARNAGFPNGVVPEETMTEWAGLQQQLFGVPVPGGPRQLQRPQAPQAAPPMGGAPDAGAPPIPTSTPVQEPPGPPPMQPQMPRAGPGPGPRPVSASSSPAPQPSPAGPPPGAAGPPPGGPPPPRLDMQPPGTMVRVQLPGHPPSRPVPAQNAQRFVLDHPNAVILPADG
jgi:hypothetical protein